MTAPTDASIIAFHAKVQCRCCIVDVASHLTASTPTDAPIVAFHTKVQVVCAIGQWAETGLDSTVMNHFKESDATPTDASIIAFHVKVQVVCTIGQWTDCCRVVDDALHNDAKEAHRAC